MDRIANIKKFLWDENASIEAEVFIVLTEDGHVYTWGKKSLTGSDGLCLDKTTQDGFLSSPCQIN